MTADKSDAELVAKAVRSFARELDLPQKAVELRGGGPRRRVLDLHAAALVAVLGEASTQPVRVDIGEVLGELLRHEQHFWYDSAQSIGVAEGQSGTTPRTLRQIIAASCRMFCTRSERIVHLQDTAACSAGSPDAVRTRASDTVTSGLIR
jgi:hypothetical protein